MKKKVVMLAFVSVLLLSLIVGAKFITFCSNGSSTITVAAIQPEFHFFFVNETDYRIYMTELMEQAMNYTPDLVLFPEDVGTPLLGLRFPNINSYATLEEAMMKEGVWPNQAFYRAANVAGTAYLNTFSSLAVNYSVYVIAGTIMLPDGVITGGPGNYVYNKTGTEDKVYNVAYFFYPNGSIIGTQKKVHLIDLELYMRLAPSTEEALQVFDVDIRGISVGVGIAVCADGFYDSVGHILAQKGADIIFQPTFNPHPLNDYEHNFVNNSVWSRSQNQLVYGVLSCGVGELLDLTFTGKSAITAPINLTGSQDGIVAMANVFNSSTVVHGVLDVQALHDLWWSLGDVDYNRVIDVMDVLIVGIAFGSKPGDSNWNPIADLYHDLPPVIDAMDVLQVAIHFGKTW